MEQKTTQRTQKSNTSPVETSITERTLFDTVGDELQRARLAQKLDIETVANQLKIKSCYLEALEQNDYTQFPAVAYGIGFLRTYARFLGLDGEALVGRFKSETMHLEPHTAQMPILNQHNILPSKKIIYVCVVLLLVLFGGWYMHHKVSKPTEVSFTEPIMTAPETVPEPVVTAPVESDTILNQDVEAIANELNVVVPLEDNIQQLPVSEDVEKVEEEKPFDVVTGKKYGTEKGAVLVLVATERVWVKVRNGERVIFEHILSKGDGYFVPVDLTGLKLHTGNARGLEVYVNGVSKGKLSKTETVKNNVLLEPTQFAVE